MASGSTVSLSGGTTMTQVVSGDTILDDDFNNARTNVNTLMGSRRCNIRYLYSIFNQRLGSRWCRCCGCHSRSTCSRHRSRRL
jgi:hypothetical protein